MVLKATYFGSNSWLIEMSGKKILLDPWLRGDLIFAPGKWFLRGQLTKEWPIPQGIDLILLTQGLEDHAHPETLKSFSKETMVICSKTASKVVNEIGFKCIKVLKAGEEKNFQSLNIKAFGGAKVPNQENGYICSSKTGSFYIEPHGYLDYSTPSMQIDVVITPIVDIGLPLVGNFINGETNFKDLLDRLNPKYVLASTNGGDIKFDGLLSKFIKTSKGVRNSLLESNCKVIIPRCGENYLLK